jgi:hypothetical protein
MMGHQQGQGKGHGHGLRLLRQQWRLHRLPPESPKHGRLISIHLDCGGICPAARVGVSPFHLSLQENEIIIMGGGRGGLYFR